MLARVVAAARGGDARSLLTEKERGGISGSSHRSDTFRRVLEGAVGHGQEKLGLEQEVAEARGVDADVGAPVEVW